MDEEPGIAAWRATVGNALAIARTIRGVTQEELSEWTLVPRPVISRIERGRVQPRWETAVRLFEGLGFQLELTPARGDRDEPRDPAAVIALVLEAQPRRGPAG